MMHGSGQYQWPDGLIYKVPCRSITNTNTHLVFIRKFDITNLQKIALL